MTPLAAVYQWKNVDPSSSRLFSCEITLRFVPPRERIVKKSAEKYQKSVEIGEKYDKNSQFFDLKWRIQHWETKPNNQCMFIIITSCRKKGGVDSFSRAKVKLWEAR